LKIDSHHAFDRIIDNFARFADEFKIVGGDGLIYRLYQTEGSLNGKVGLFEWLVHPNIKKGIVHRRFRIGAVVDGKINGRRG